MLRPSGWAFAGVGKIPTRNTSAPADVRPAVTAASSISPLARGSRPTTATGRCPRPRSASTRAAAPDKAIASSGVSSELANPRTPSVPKRRGMNDAAAVLTLRVLGSLARLLQAVLLALFRPGIPGEETRLLQCRAV